jgi:hypothetical protein
MKPLSLLLSLCAFASGTLPVRAADPAPTRSPVDQLPAHIKRLTWFGERADWSHDGKRILFLGKTFGDVYEVELASGIIRPLTHHYRHLEPTTSISGSSVWMAAAMWGV